MSTITGPLPRRAMLLATSALGLAVVIASGSSIRSTLADAGSRSRGPGSATVAAPPSATVGALAASGNAVTSPRGGNQAATDHSPPQLVSVPIYLSQATRPSRPTPESGIQRRPVQPVVSRNSSPDSSRDDSSSLSD
jgi:hypothetical protein